MESLTSTGAAPARASPPRPRPHVVLVASPGAGHLIPMAELARRLAEHHGFAPTLVTFTTDLSSPEEAMSCLPDSLATSPTIALPPVQIDDLPHDTPIEILLLELVRRSVPNLRALLRSIDGPIAALVPDFFCSAALPLAAELGVPGFLFVPSNLAALALMRRLVDLHHGVDVAPGQGLS